MSNYEKKKFLTFSYDDGVTQDKRLVKIFHKYGLKATFNINSELLGKPGYLRRENMWISHNKIESEEVAELYKEHEVAVHTLNHPNLTEMPDDGIVYQVEQDRKNLEKLLQRKIEGMAYPGSTPNFDDRVAEVIQKNTQIRYARTTISNYSFDVQKDLLRFKPTVHHTEFDRMMELGEKFLKLKPVTPQIFYVWGHSYEFDYYDTWGEFEKFCRMMSGRDDIFYGTNSEVLL